MKDNSLSYRRYVIGGAAILIVVVYTIRLFMLQVTSDDYKKSADSNAFLKKIEYPSRGNISDRNGKLMVFNQPSYDIMVVMNEARDRIDTTEFCQTLGITKEEFDYRMAVMKDRNKNPGYSRFTQQLFISQLSDKDFSLFQEKMFRFPGFYVQKRSVRQYQYPLAAHVLGDVAEVSPADIEEDDYYQPGDYIGKLGIERKYEKQLRGVKGIQILLRDAHGRIQGKRRDVGRIGVELGVQVFQGDGDASAARSDIKERCVFVAEIVADPVHQLRRFRAGDQHVPVHLEGESVELPLAEDVLDRFPLGESVEYLLHLGRLLFRQVIMFAHEQIHHTASADMLQGEVGDVFRLPFGICSRKRLHDACDPFVVHWFSSSMNSCVSLVGVL